MGVGSAEDNCGGVGLLFVARTWFELMNGLGGTGDDGDRLCANTGFVGSCLELVLFGDNDVTDEGFGLFVRLFVVDLEGEPVFGSALFEFCGECRVTLRTSSLFCGPFLLTIANEF